MAEFEDEKGGVGHITLAMHKLKTRSDDEFPRREYSYVMSPLEISDVGMIRSRMSNARTCPSRSFIPDSKFQTRILSRA